MRLEAKGISRRYFRNKGSANTFFVVKETDFVLEPGRITALHGRSGGGKSTLLQMLSGLLTPTTGEVLLDGQSLYTLQDRELSRLRNAHLGVIPQGKAAVGSLSVLENVLLPAQLYGQADEQTRKEAAQLLERLGMAELAGVRPRELSGGELRRMSIARALAAKPGVLLADEPTGDLDDLNTKTVLDLFAEAADRGCAVLLVTHDRDSLSVAQDVWRMDAGVLTHET